LAKNFFFSSLKINNVKFCEVYGYKKGKTTKKCPFFFVVDGSGRRGIQDVKKQDPG
jgi:hypothetical protein